MHPIQSHKYHLMATADRITFAASSNISGHMKNNIYPCIWFDGTAHEAASLYCSVFPKAKITMETPLVVQFDIEGQRFMGLNGGPTFRPNPSISFMAWYDDEAPIRQAHDLLTAGGTIMMDLGTYPWSELYSMIRDRYGVCWQLYYGKREDTWSAFVPTMMFNRQMTGRAEEAMHFYTGLFPDSSVGSILRYGPGQKDKEGTIQHAQFTIDGHLFACMDSAVDDGYSFDEGLSLVKECDTQEEIDHYWYSLTADGGNESMCGWLKDKYGVSWQIIPRQIGQLMMDPERGQAAMDALLQMRKIDIHLLMAAGQ